MFLLNVDALLDLFHIHERTPLVHIIGALLLFKAWLLIILCLYVFFKRCMRMISRRNNDVRHLNHLRNIFVFVQSRGLELSPVSKRERYFFRRLLVLQMDVMEESEQKWLRVLYRQMGYYDEDLQFLKSAFWWVRLAALVRLETAKLEESTPWITKLIEDPSDFVSIVAMRALSRMQDAERMTPVLEALSRRAPARRDIFIEVLTNFGENQVQEIIQYLESTYDPHIASICIEVLGLLKAEESRAFIETLATSSDDGVAEAVAKALGEIGDLESLDVLRNLTAHESSQVRAQALRSLGKLKDPRLQWYLQELKGDQTLSVRRVLFQLAADQRGAG